MKKIIIFLFVLVLILLNGRTEKTILIPKESIRFRIIANSNLAQDQLLKLDVRNKLMPVLSKISATAKNIDDARKNISQNMDEIENVLNTYSDDYKINFGMNFFPEKTYENVKYSSGKYESLVITLGSGIGDNWWCVLFPPLCLLEAEKDSLGDVAYDMYLKKIINKYS